MKLEHIPNHTLITGEGASNVSVLRSKYEPDLFVVYPTNLGEEHCTHILHLIEGESGVEQAIIERHNEGEPEWVTSTLCANFTSHVELFQKLYDIEP